MVNIIYQQEKLFNVKDEVQGILEEHWEEVGLHKDKIPLDPNWELYKLLEENGNISITTARDKDKIVGYFGYIITPSLHSRNIKVAEGDLFYIHKEYRKSTIAIKLLALSEKYLLEGGVNIIFNKTKEYFKNIRGISAGSLFERAGYQKIENVYSKLLG